MLFALALPLLAVCVVLLALDLTLLVVLEATADDTVALANTGVLADAGTFADTGTFATSFDGTGVVDDADVLEPLGGLLVAMYSSIR